MVSCLMTLRISNSAALLGLDSTVSACRFSSKLNFLNISSNNRDNNAAALCDRDVSRFSTNNTHNTYNTTQHTTQHAIQHNNVQFQTFVAIVIFVIEGGRIAHAENDSADHQRHIDRLQSEVIVLHRDMRQHNRRQNLTRLFVLVTRE